MYENLGEKLKGLAIFSMIIGILASVIGGIIEIDQEAGRVGVITMIVGSLVSWIASWSMYAVGQILDNTEELLSRMNGKFIKKHIDENKASSNNQNNKNDNTKNEKTKDNNSVSNESHEGKTLSTDTNINADDKGEKIAKIVTLTIVGLVIMAVLIALICSWLC